MANTGRILMAEDDPDYATLFQIALTDAGISNPVDVVTDGYKAMEYLKARKSEADTLPPAMIMLDMRLPVYHGLDVLRWIRRQSHLKNVFVMMLSGSGFENEAGAALQSGASHFLVKPLQFGQLVSALTHLRETCLHEEPLLAGRH